MPAGTGGAGGRTAWGRGGGGRRLALPLVVVVGGWVAEDMVMTPLREGEKDGTEWDFKREDFVLPAG